MGAQAPAEITKLVTTSTEGDANSRTKTETETTSGVDVKRDDDGTIHLKNTETTRMTKTVASSNVPLLPEEEPAVVAEGRVYFLGALFWSH